MTSENRILRNVLISLLVFVGLVASGVGWLNWIQRPEHRPAFYARVTVDMTVNELPVHLERVITCKTIKISGRWMDRAYAEWISTPRAFGEVLPDGSSVMVWTPYRCGREKIINENGETQIRAQQNAPDYLPLIGWSPDGVNVDHLEIYIADTYFSQPDARVKNIRIGIELVDPRQHPPSEPDLFAWFSTLSHSGERDYQEQFYMTYAGWKIPKDVWAGKDEELDALLATYEKPTPIPRSFGIVSDIVKKHYFERHSISNNILRLRQVWRGLASSKLGFERPSVGQPVRLKRARTLIDFDIEDGAVRLDRNQAIGMYRMRRWLPRKRKDEGNPKQRGGGIAHVPVLLKDQRFEPVSSRFFFDPETQEIYWIDGGFALRAYPHRDHPISQDQNKRRGEEQ